jgi:hypothetical protein
MIFLLVLSTALIGCFIAATLIGFFRYTKWLNSGEAGNVLQRDEPKH